DLEMVVSQARQLLKHVKVRGGNQFSTDWFSESTQSSQQFVIATHLLRGLADNEFHAYYQPQVDLSTGNFIGVEALVRWHHHEWGTLEPGQFIPIAEETGSIVQIDEHMLRLACRAAHKWQQRGHEPLNVSVNLSAYSFNRPNLCDLVQDVLFDFDVSPEWLELEITESVLLQDKDRAANIMHELKAIGVSLALDDFGIGYSSLSYLQRFPLDTLKIDRAFITGVDTNRGNAAITEAVIRLARNLNLKVVAEGVERIEEREFLKQRNCDAMQGFLISHPVPEAVFQTLLNSQMPVRQAA
ncbi:MAG: EAL domain-containing protein, partial [Cyanobacteria bacterium P01_F01_bin.42]